MQTVQTDTCNCTTAEISKSFRVIMGLSYDKGHLEKARPILGRCVCYLKQ